MSNGELKEKVRTDSFMYIQKILERRAMFVKLTTLTLISVLVLAATVVSLLIVNGKESQMNWITQALSVSRKQLELGDLVFFGNDVKNSKHVGVYLGEGKFKTLSSTDKPVSKTGIDSSEFVRKTFQEQFGLDLPKPYEKSQSEKIADSIATVLLNLSLIIFIGFVMKAVLVFIRYYMQLGTDFENQKIAHLISGGDNEVFSNLLGVLREHNINFEKTPVMPQEKIILSVIDALKSNKPV